MIFEKDSVNEIVSKDVDGNVWKISLVKMKTKTNRFQLSFHFNEKEFDLMKLQSYTAAENIWREGSSQENEVGSSFRRFPRPLERRQGPDSGRRHHERIYRSNLVKSIEFFFLSSASKLARQFSVIAKLECPRLSDMQEMLTPLRFNTVANE